MKPGALQRGLVGEVISRFEKRGLKLVAMKMKQLDQSVLDEHYAHLKDKPFFPWLCSGMMAAPVILCCWEGFEAVKVVRAMAGSTNARNAAPGTIRGDYALSAQENIVHTSDSVDSLLKIIAAILLRWNSICMLRMRNKKACSGS